MAQSLQANKADFRYEAGVCTVTPAQLTSESTLGDIAFYLQEQTQPQKDSSSDACPVLRGHVSKAQKLTCEIICLMHLYGHLNCF